MKTSRLLATLLIGGTLSTGGQLFAAQKDYQVTGPVLEMTDTTIVVQKGTEKWELSRDTTTKVTGDLKVGSKVTIHYTMGAKSIEVKPEKAGPK